MRVVLASASPRRRELLARLIKDFRVISADIDEARYNTSDPVETAKILATEKAKVVSAQNPQDLVIAGDTIVAVDNQQLGKPADEADAVRMLRLLSNRSHTVITGVSLRMGDKQEVFAEVTEVVFRYLSNRDIEDYVAMGDVMDKAGSYAIQGGAARFVQEIRGSHTNVVGLPVEALREHLMSFGYRELL